MKLPRHLRIAMAGLAVVTLINSSPSAAAEGKYAPLLAALGQEKQEALAAAEEALLLAEGYQDYLADPDLDTDERPELRKSLIEVRARHKQERARAALLQVAIRELGRMPEDKFVTLATLKEMYKDLGDISARGRDAWDNVLSSRTGNVEDLQTAYNDSLNEATLAQAELQSRENITQILLDAIDTNRGDSTDAEFHVALKLPSIKTAVELGFNISNRTDDRDRQAQTTLIALIGYSQFFWDHYSGARTFLADEEVPSDRMRNIFGIPDGQVLTSEAIAFNRSNFYYLAKPASERFNRMIRVIWGEEGTLAVSSWNQKYADQFHRACKALATSADESLQPNPEVFALLERIESMVAAEEHVRQEIEGIHADYKAQLAAAQQFGDEARLSSASYNAQLWSRESKALIKGFEKSELLLDGQLSKCGEGDWIPQAKAIATSAQTIAKAQKRFYAVRKVKKELTSLLAQKDSTIAPPQPGL